MFSRKFYNQRPVILWPLVLVIVLQVIYLVAEVGFNASLLNLATGAADDTVKLDDLEIFGRIFAGIGLGLLFFSGQACRYGLNQYITSAVVFRLGLIALTIFSISITGMWYFQKWLIDDVVIASQTSEQRESARYVQYLAPALRQGLISLEELPLETQNLDRPDAKTAITLLSPMLLNNPRLVAQLSASVPEIVKFMAHRGASSALNETFEAFRENQDTLDFLWKTYTEVRGQIGTNPAANSVHDSVRGNQSTLKSLYSRYIDKSNDRLYRYGDRIRQYANMHYRSCKSLADPVMGSIYRMSGNSSCGGKESPYNLYGDRIHYEMFCPNHNNFSAKKCVTVPDTRAATTEFGRKVLNRWSKHRQKAIRGKLGVYLKFNSMETIPSFMGPAEFYNHSKIREKTDLPYVGSLRDDDFNVRLGRDGSVIGMSVSGYINRIAEGAGTKITGKQFVAAVQSQMSDLPDTLDLESLERTITGAGTLTKADFFALRDIRTLHGMDHLVSEAITRDAMDVDDPAVFFQKVVIPATLKRVEETVSTLPDIAGQTGVSELIGSQYMPLAKRRTAEEQALRAVYVPAIALSFSLLFTLTNLIGVMGRVVRLLHMTTAPITPAVYSKLKKVVSLGGLAVIFTLPVVLTPNSLMHSRLLDVALAETEASYAEYLPLPVKWVLAVQPVVYPVGNTLLGWSPLDSIRAYHDTRSVEASSEPIDSIDVLNLARPFTVADLQRRLNALGYDAGPIDGIIGTRTTAALKRFQSAAGLDVTGYQDSATIAALKKGISASGDGT